MKFVWSILLLAALTVSAEVIEAETGKLDPAGAKIEENKDASGGQLVRMVGKYVMKPEAVKTDAPGLTVPFKIAAAGKYEIKLFVLSPTASKVDLRHFLRHFCIFNFRSNKFYFV